MSDERALFAAICAQPEEDTPRLAYADWLDEHAGAMPREDRECARMQAELIRVQCELARLPPEEEDVETATRRVELELREGELVQSPAGAQFTARVRAVSPLPGFAGLARAGHGFVRGFPLFATADAATFLATGAALFDIYPVHYINCWNIHGALADQFLGQPWLARARRLWISTDRDRSGMTGNGWETRSDGTDVPTTEKLFASRVLANLEELELRNWEFGRPGSHIAGRPLAGLRRLKLWGGRVGGPEAFVRLGELLPAEVRLRDFNLGSTRYGAEELAVFAALPQFRSLERLEMSLRYGEGWEPPALGPAGVQAITASPFWPNLRAFSDNQNAACIGAAEIMELIAAPPAPNLRTLNLGSGNFRMGFVPLMGSPLLGSLTTLDLSNVCYGDFLASYVRWCLYLGRLLNLKLNNCEIATKGVRDLAEAPFAQSLVRLELRRNALRKQAVDVLVAPGSFPRLRLLDVGGSVRNPTQQERLRKRFGNGVIL